MSCFEISPQSKNIFISVGNKIICSRLPQFLDKKIQSSTAFVSPDGQKIKEIKVDCKERILVIIGQKIYFVRLDGSLKEIHSFDRGKKFIFITKNTKIPKNQIFRFFDIFRPNYVFDEAHPVKRRPRNLHKA